jgi:polysaccharide deacetylase family protein (PEP-CTERM system associated)
MHNALTIDVEDWFHVCGIEDKIPTDRWDAMESRVQESTQRVLDMLDRYQVRATFFVLGYVADRHPELVRTIHEAGHEVGSHGYWHRKVFLQTPAEFEADIRRSREVLKSVLGFPPKAYRAPEWSIDRPRRWAYEVLRSAGFQDDSSMMPLSWIGGVGLRTEPFVQPTASGALRVFPATCMRLFWDQLPFTAGLGFRVSPYWYTAHYFDHLNRRGQPGMVCLHPWEFDPKQPRLPMGPVLRWMHGFNLGAIRRKTEGLLRHFPFAPMSEVLDSVLPSATPATAVRLPTEVPS